MDLTFDRNHLWHPYTSATNPLKVYPVEKAEGVYLYLEDGTKLIDGMSSWWSTIHGYNHPVLNKALYDQSLKMNHVMFGGLTHEPAINLAKKLVDITPQPLQRVFLADSGSVSVEVALKMAIQYWAAQSKGAKKKFLTVRNGYHGDTAGAMAVCDPEGGMHSLFEGYLPKQFFAPAPPLGFNRECSDCDIEELRHLAQTNHQHIAALIIEPIVQGAGGMRIYSPSYLQKVRAICDEFDLLLIIDEIATGFGRTGKLFACEHAEVIPDIMCVGKALTGGQMTLGATLTTHHIAETISKSGGVMMHGPTFMGNPLACAVANASIDLLLSTPWQKHIATIEQTLTEQLTPLSTLNGVKEVRILGAIGVIELNEPVDMEVITALFVEEGIWLRPFGKLVYTMPPFVITPAELTTLCDATSKVITAYLSTISD